MVKLAKNHPVKFIALLACVVVLYAVCGTDIVRFAARGAGTAGAVQYIHVGAHNNITPNAVTEVEVALTDQAGKPVTGKEYGNKPGNYYLPTDAITTSGGQTVRFNVDAANARERHDSNDNPLGVYVIPVTITEWPAGYAEGVYFLQARYTGGGPGTGDNVNNDAYMLKAMTSFTSDGEGREGVIKYLPIEAGAMQLTAPEARPDNPEPASLENVITVRVKPVAQARAEATGDRRLSGLAEAENLAKWLEPIAVDSNGGSLDIEYGEIVEEEAGLKGKNVKPVFKTGIYRVQLKIKVPASAAGQKVAYRFGLALNGAEFITSGTANISVTPAAEPGAQNPYFANPYILDPPHTPYVEDIVFFGTSGTNEIELAEIDENPTNGHKILNADGDIASIDGMRISALISDPDLIDIGEGIVGAEVFRQDNQPDISQNGTGLTMAPDDGSFDSPDETVIYTIPSATIDTYEETQQTFWIHGKNTNNEWGEFMQIIMSVDRTKPTCAVTAPVTGQIIHGQMVRAEGDANANVGGAYRSPMNSVQIYEEGTADFTDVAENDSGRGGLNYSKWYHVFDTTFTEGEQYLYQARAVDIAGNISDVATSSPIIDNTKPIANITSPLQGIGVDNTVTTSFTLTGSAYDPDTPPLGDLTFDHYKVEWAPGIKNYGDELGWNLVNTSTNSVMNGQLGIWDVSDTVAYPSGNYSLRVTSTDKAGNINLDKNYSPNINRIYVHIDRGVPAATVNDPATGWFVRRLTGSATDDVSGVGKVEMIIRRTDTNKFWSGSAWVDTEPADLPDATFTAGAGTTAATWEYVINPVSLPDGTNLEVKAKASDDVTPTAHSSVSAAVTRPFDGTAPATTTAPAPDGLNSWYVNAPAVTITAIDPGAGSTMNGGTVWYVWTTINVGSAPTDLGRYTASAYGTNPLSVNGPSGSPDGAGIYAAGGTTVPQGRYRLWYKARDVATNIETTHYTDFKVDLTNPPTAGLWAENWAETRGSDVGESAWTEGLSNTVYGLRVTDNNEDNQTVWYLVQRSTSSNFTTGLVDSGWVANSTYVGNPVNNYAFYAGFSGMVDGTIYYYRVRTRDYAGRETAFTGSYVQSGQDNLPPVVSQNSGVTAVSTWYNVNKPVDITITDTASGPAGIRWAWDVNPGADSNSWVYGMSAGGGGPHRTWFPGVGKRTLYVYGYDNIYSNDHLNNYEPKHRTGLQAYEFWYDPYAPYNWQTFTYAATYDGWSNTQTPSPSITIQDDIAVPSSVSGLKVTSAVSAFSTDGGATWSAWTAAACTGSDGSPNTETITAANVPFNNDSADQNKIRFRIQDVAGNVVTSPDFIVKVDGTPPAVMSTVPANDPDPDTSEPLVATNTPLTVTFSDDMLASTAGDITNYTVEMADSGSSTWTPVAMLGASYDQTTRTAALAPVVQLQPNKKYRITVAATVKDKAGNSLAAPYIWEFFVSDINVAIDWPVEGNKVYGNLPVIGQVGGLNATEYKLQYGLGANPLSWTDITGGLAAPKSGGLWTQTDWVGGSTGALPEVATGTTTKYWQGANVNTASVPGTVRLARTAAAGAWLNNNWMARKKIVVTNPNNYEITNYQVKITVPYQADMKPDFSDIRFTDTDKTTQLGFWVESVNPGDNAVVWVKVPQIWILSTRTIYMYYDNPAAASASSVANTFFANQIYKRQVNHAVDTYPAVSTHANIESLLGGNLAGGSYLTAIDGGNSYAWATSQYKFLFIPSISGNYKIGTNSDDASDIIRNTYDLDSDHSVVVGWYGYHGTAGNIDDHSAFTNMTANQPVWFEYRQHKSNGAGLARMGVMVPGASWATLNTTNFPGQIFARAYAVLEPTAVIENDAYYEASGSVVSSVYDAGVSSDWQIVSWSERIKSGTDITVQVRTGGDATPEDGGWTAWSYPRTISSGDPLPVDLGADRYVQYKVNLTSDPAGTKSPVLEDILLMSDPLGYWDTTGVVDGTYTIRLVASVSSDPDPLIKWADGSVLTDTVTVVVENDANNDMPDSDITSPADNAYAKATHTISGTATDAFPGIGKVELRITRDEDGYFWDGSGWTDEETWVLTDSSGSETATWAYTVNDGFETDKDYTIDSRATDKANKVESTYDTIHLTGDAIAPAASITFPLEPNNFVGAPFVGIAGQAGDARFKDYKVEYQKDGDTAWASVAPTHTSEPAAPSAWTQTSDADFNTGVVGGTAVKNNSVTLSRRAPLANYISSGYQDASFNAQGFQSSGAGVVATDGTYLYIKRYGTYEGPTNFTKIGTGYGGTTAGTIYAVLANGANANTISAFAYGGYVYNGYTTDGRTLQRQNTATGVVDYVTLGGTNRLMGKANGADLSAASTDILITTDGRYMYNVGVYNGSWRVKIFDPANGFNLVSSYVAVMEQGMSSYYTGAVVADGYYIYPIELVNYSIGAPRNYGTGYWPQTGMRLMRIGTGLTGTATLAGELLGQWTLDGTDKFMIGGQYDRKNAKVWLGMMRGGTTVYRYNTADEFTTNGTFTSAVFDAGSTVDWNTAAWTQTGTGTLIIETRSGPSRTPDSTWSGWTAVANGAAISSPNDRFIQYRATYTGAGNTTSPSLDQISIRYTDASKLLDTWALTGLTNGKYRLRLTVTDQAGNVSVANSDPVYIDNEAPIAALNELLNLDGNQTGYVAGAAVPLKGTASDANLDGWIVERKRDDEADWTSIATGTGEILGIETTWSQTDWSAGSGQALFNGGNAAKYLSDDGNVNVSGPAGSVTLKDAIIQTLTNPAGGAASASANETTYTSSFVKTGATRARATWTWSGMTYTAEVVTQYGTTPATNDTAGLQMSNDLGLTFADASLKNAQAHGTAGTETTAAATGNAVRAWVHEDGGNSTPAINITSIDFYGYANSGMVTSSVYDSGGFSTSYGLISWTENRPAGTSIALQTRTGSTATPDAGWSTWSVDRIDPSGQAILSPANRYIQYRIILTSATGAATPRVDNVVINMYGGSNQFGVWDTVAEEPAENDHDYAVRVRVRDKAGNVTTSDERVVKIDNTPPQVSTTLPLAGATNVDPGANITAYFDDLLYAYSIQSPAAAFTVNAGGVTPREINYVDQITTAYSTFKPAVKLATDQTYNSNISIEVKNKAGLAMIAPYAWSFTTAKAESQLYSPFSNTYISGQYPIMGYSGGSQFGAYRLEYQAGRHTADQAGGWTQIGTDRTAAVSSQKGIQTDWFGGLASGADTLVPFGTTTNKYLAKDANVVTNSGHSRLGSNNTRWMAGAWTQRRPITINNSANTSALTDFQVRVTVPSDSNMKSDYSDLRFTDSDGQTLLNYWIESYTTASAVVWIKVPSIPVAANKTVYVYYGNAGAPAAQNPNGTFELFDDFNTGTAVDPVKWDAAQAAAGLLQSTGKGMLKGYSTSGRLISNASFSYPIVVETKAMIYHAPYNGVMLGGLFGSTSNGFGVMYPSQYRTDGSWVSSGATLAEQTWYKTIIEARNQFRSKYRIVNASTEALIAEGIVPNIVTSEKVALGLKYDNANGGEPYSGSWDWVMVHKYSPYTPTASVGAPDGFQKSGSLTSVVFDGGGATNWSMISWTENVPLGGNVTVQTRAGNVSVPDGTWTAWSAASGYGSGSVIPAGQAGKRYIQYRVNLYSNSATVMDVTIWHTPLITWDTTAGLADGLYTLRLVTTDTAGVWDDAHVQRKAVTVNIDNTKPVVAFSSPAAASLLTNMQTVTGTASDAGAGVGKPVELNVDGGEWLISTGTNRVSQDDAAAVYSSGWSQALGIEPTDGTILRSTTAGSSVTYTFTGTSISWIGVRGPEKGIASVSIDGNAAIPVDLYNIDELHQQVVFGETGLNPGTHTITIVVTGTANPASNGTAVDVDGFAAGGTINWTYDWVTNGLADSAHTMNARVTDRAGMTGDIASRVFNTDNTDPTAAVTAPVANGAFTTDQTVVGTAADVNFDRYVLEYGYGASFEDWTPIGTYTNAVNNGTLGTWTAPKDTTLYHWSTDGDPENWMPQQQITNVSVSNSSFNGRSTGTDPYIKTSQKLTINGNEVKTLTLRMKVSSAGSYARLYWKYYYPYFDSYPTVNGINLPLGEQVTGNKEDEWGYAANFGESRRMIKWPTVSSGQWVTYRIDMSLGKVFAKVDGQANETLVMDYSLVWPTTGFWAGTIQQLRFDPVEASGVNFNIDSLSIQGADGNYRIRETVYDKVGRSAQAGVYPVMIDRNTPACYITSPINMTFMSSLNSVAVSGKSVDDAVNGVASGINRVELRVVENIDSFAPTVGPWLPASGTTTWSKTVSLVSGWYGLQARAFDNAGNVQESNFSYITVDNDPPPVPRLRAMPDRTRNGILLSWTPVKDPGSGVDHYVLYRGNTPITTGLQYPDGVAIEASNVEVRTKNFGAGNENYRAFEACNAIDTAFTPNNTMRYYIRAVDAVGNYSSKGSIAVVYDTQPPTDPSGLTGTSAGATNAATLSWTASTDNQAVAEYRIYRDTVANFAITNEKQVGRAEVVGTFFTTKFYDPELEYGRTYYYKVVAYDDSLNPSNESNEAAVVIGTEQDFSDELPHLTFTDDPTQCNLCHATHTSVGRRLLKKETEADLCFTCHDGTGSNTPTKAEFDFAPSGLHRVRDAEWPNGALSCIDCHNPHLNTENAWFENFDDDMYITTAAPPNEWAFSGGDWGGTIDILPTASDGTPVDATHNELKQASTSGSYFARRDTGIDIAAKGGNFSTMVVLLSGDEAYLTLAGDGTTARRGVTLSVDNANQLFVLRNGDTVYRSSAVTGGIVPGTEYRIKLKIDAKQNLTAGLYAVVETDLATGQEKITDTELARIAYKMTAGDFAGTWLEIGTSDASAAFDTVKVNSPGMLQTRYRAYHKGTSKATYLVPDDRIGTEAFCLSCHGSSSDSPGGNQSQFYTSVHNPLMGGMDGQVMDEDNSNYIKTDPNSLTPRWQEIRDEWKDIRTNPSYILTDGKTIGEQLASTENSCLYCHGYHGQQFYDRTQAGEEELCYKCHGKVANYSRDDWNVYEQYNNYDVNGKLIGSRHGLTLREATIKCTSCHGQRAMTDRHVYEGYSTSIITNPNNIKQYWSDMRTKGKTINDYCNVCHKEADRKGRVLIETHTASKIVPYTVKYPPMLTTSSANGFDRTGYTLGDMYTYQENYASIAKVGAWLEDTTEGNQYESDAAVYSETGLDYVEFQFEGTYVAWTAKKDTDRGIAQVFIDGQPVHDAEYKLATDNPVADYRSGVDLYSGIPVWKFVAYQVSGLPIGTHTIRVQLTGLKNPLSSGIRIDLDSFKFAVPRVGHFLFYPDTGNCAGTCHDGLPAYIRDSQEAKTKITCVTCHHPHASENARLVHQGEDSKNQAGVVTKGACLHCHDGSVTK